MSTSNLATNPRLVKEIELALRNGFRVTVLICSFRSWSCELNEGIKQRFGARIHLIEADATRSSLLLWWRSTVQQRFQKIKYKLGFSTTRVLSDVLIKRGILLRWKLRHLRGKYQLVIAHNIGAFEPVEAFAAEHQIPFGIDVEDYHPGETIDPGQSQCMKQLMQKVLPKAVYVSAAAPLILDSIRNDCRNRIADSFVILNYFRREEFVAPIPKENERLKFIWFSQNISFNRGLEHLLPIFQFSDLKAELHLFGNMDDAFRVKYIKTSANVIVHRPLPQEELHRVLSDYDVGLAIEPGRDINNQLALSNKLLAYYQAGLYILATNTPAQRQFLRRNPAHGTCASLNELHEKIQALIENSEIIRLHALDRYLAASINHSNAELIELDRHWKKILNQGV